MGEGGGKPAGLPQPLTMSAFIPCRNPCISCPGGWVEVRQLDTGYGSKWIRRAGAVRSVARVRQEHKAGRSHG